jgi:hypothetical protein
MEKLIDRARGTFKAMADQIAGTLKGITYKADMAAKAVAKIVKGVSKGQQRTTVSPGALPARRPITDSRRRQTRRLGTIGAGAGVMALVVSALLSGCYYRGRPPEYGRRGYGHRYDRRY